MVGASCAGKTFIRDKFRERGYKIDVSYTSREPRHGEIDGIDYNFISKNEFNDRICYELFYEFVQYGDNFYGTGLKEWNESDVFIMETDGIKKITSEDRKNCLIIYINTPLEIRKKRMKERGWDENKIIERLNIDNQKFNMSAFKDFDLQISSAEYPRGLPHYK